jgi:hypothetical protein
VGVNAVSRAEHCSADVGKEESLVAVTSTIRFLTPPGVIAWVRADAQESATLASGFLGDPLAQVKAGTSATSPTPQAGPSIARRMCEILANGDHLPARGPPPMRE